MRQEKNYNANAHKRRKRRRRRPSKFAYVLILLVITLCAAAVCVAVFCKVEKVTVTGKSQYNNAQIVKASRITLGTNLFKVNKKETEKNIESALPYILKADVKYSFPNAVKVEVVSEDAKFVVKNGSKRVLANSQLKILKTDADDKECEKKITIDGVKFKTSVAGELLDTQKKEQFTELKGLVDSINKSGVKKITEINVSDSFQISAVYDSRITIVLGTSYNTEQKLKNASEIITKYLHDTDKGKLDVSTLNKRYTYTPA